MRGSRIPDDLRQLIAKYILAILAQEKALPGSEKAIGITIIVAKLNTAIQKGEKLTEDTPLVLPKEHFAGEQIALGSGGTYLVENIITQLESGGYIEKYNTKPRKTPYRLTEAGKDVLEKKVDLNLPDLQKTGPEKT